jgi:hypothetical protein
VKISFGKIVLFDKNNQQVETTTITRVGSDITKYGDTFTYG